MRCVDLTTICNTTTISPLTDTLCSMTFFPLPGTYLVVEIDKEKTLEGLNDPSANEAAAALQTTKCIVFLETVCVPSSYSVAK